MKHKSFLLLSLTFVFHFIPLSVFSNQSSQVGGPRHSYDVLNYKLNLDIYNCFRAPYPSSYKALNTITLRVDSTLNYIKLNANSISLAIDSVRLGNNAVLNFSYASNFLTVTLNRVYNPGETLDLKIYYRHNNVPDTSYNIPAGFIASNGLIYTQCEPEGARKWFPCWDKPSDKATTDITVKVPSNVLLGSNGRLVDSVRSGDTIYFRWISRDPMSSYLVAIVGSSHYRQIIKYWHKTSNPSDSIPIRIYYNSWRDPSHIRDSINIIANYFSQLFCEYPFEKIGFADVDSTHFGCMENQTLISVYPSGWNTGEIVIAHEFGHHWFGDLITCGTWADIWLNESFGQYFEALIQDHFLGREAYLNEMKNDSEYYFSSNSYLTPIYNPAYINYTPPSWLILSYSLVYCKGACVLHMLRNMLGDSTFFNVLKSYTNDTNFVFKTAVTDDFTAKLNQVTGQDYTWFVNEWIKQPGHPKYTNTYGISNLGNGNWRINFRTSQNISFAPFHKMPIELKVKFHNNSDTILKVMNDANNQLFIFDFSKQPDSLQFDPENRIILKAVTTTIGIRIISSEIPDKYFLYQNYPNPFNPTTIIKFQIKEPGFTTLKIYDLTGREMKSLVNENLTPGSYTAEFVGSDISSGVYFYKLTAGDYTSIKKMVLIK
ncbi:MAG: M1 family aminopeptidase [Ignavibacteria bacterium]|nr:M1 family aminopeptidase [Ignavibacteria bacterium]